MTTTTNQRCLGLIGGLGPGATIHYYQELVAAHKARGCVPRLLISHADVGRVLNDVGDNNIAGLARYLAQLIEELSRAGADVAAIAAITPHICMPQLLKRSSLPLINLVEEVARAVRSKELSRVAIFGTRFSVETGLFGQLDGVEIVRPKPDELDLIHNSYLQIVDAGCGSDEIFRVLRNLAHRLCERDGAEAIILAGTELSLVFNQANTDFPAIDCARIHIDAIMNQVLR